MLKSTNLTHSHDSFDILQLLLRSTIPLIAGMSLLLGGIWLLTLPLPGWKLILGIPAAQLGIAVLMFTFDEVTKKRYHPDQYQSVICPFCSFNNLAPKGTRTIHCGRCMEKITQIENNEFNTNSQ